nr:hypothetical protein [Prevotella sp.]
MDNIIERFNLNWIFKNETKKPRSKNNFDVLDSLSHRSWKVAIDD